MDVSTKNFKEFYEEFKLYLPKAEFVSMDLEMTGIGMYRSFPDLPFEKYLKYRNAANKFRIIQVGLCLFIKTSDNTYEARPYNVYVFPRERTGYTPQIQIDAGAANFNTQHGMNWNKWFSEGITYMSQRDAKKKRDELKEEEKSVVFDTSEVKLTRESDILKSDQFKQELKDWLASDSKEPMLVEADSKFFRRYIYETLKRDYPDLQGESVEVPGQYTKQMLIHKFTPEEKAAYLEEKKKKRAEYVEDLIGFTKVFELLVENKKKIVGHNCQYDLMFLYSHFIDSLPPSYMEFKTKLAQAFPIVYDTKFIAGQTKFAKKLSTHSHLEEVFKLSQNKEDKDYHDVDIILPEGFRAYDPNTPQNEQRFHEAGYDAYVTGCAFARMFYALDKEEQERVTNCINTVSAFFYIKNGEINHAEPWYRKYEFCFVQSTEKGEVDSEPIYRHFEKVGLNDLIKYAPITQDGWTGGLVNINPDSEEQRELFKKTCEGLGEFKLKTMTYEEYFTARTENYEKAFNKKKKEKETSEIVAEQVSQ